ncbi:glycosyltransferase family 2 protein [Salicola sp. Rm-C-2C1-2]|uniref:glycosyltransferase family 2 protein n=1 Tax=Salicola sp. Rm-C-2C1-2 TaxID=3141321 RepID=UPI0032E3B9B8
MQLSVIITTYNSPVWLEKVLWGYTQQSHHDFEIIIGDDGSGQETQACIDRFRNETNLDIKHLWQEDNGFRKCHILNQCILEASAEYLVFTDGDCIPRHDFLETHAREARQGCFLSGGYHKLPMTTSEKIAKDDILSGRCFDLAWLKSNGLQSSYKNKKLTASPQAAKLYNAITPTKCNFKGSNASAWKEDIINVNGFDERMVWGGLDRELGARLKNAGIKPKHVRYNAVVLHLDHKRGYKDPAAVQENKNIRLRIEKEGITWTEWGIRKA